MNVFLIDAIGPFFVHVPHHRHNWSKVPFQWLEVDGALPRARADEIVDAFARFCATAASIEAEWGYPLKYKISVPRHAHEPTIGLRRNGDTH